MEQFPIEAGNFSPRYRFETTPCRLFTSTDCKRFLSKIVEVFCPQLPAECKARSEVKIIVPGGAIPSDPPHNIRHFGGGGRGPAFHPRRGPSFHLKAHHNQPKHNWVGKRCQFTGRSDSTLQVRTMCYLLLLHILTYSMEQSPS
jgi:hypothetical protein